jgi:hypothetical protein
MVGTLEDARRKQEQSRKGSPDETADLTPLSPTWPTLTQCCQATTSCAGFVTLSAFSRGECGGQQASCGGPDAPGPSAEPHVCGHFGDTSRSGFDAAAGDPRARSRPCVGRGERHTERAEEHMARRQAIAVAVERLNQLAAERNLSEEIVQPIRS